MVAYAGTNPNNQVMFKNVIVEGSILASGAIANSVYQNIYFYQCANYASITLTSNGSYYMGGLVGTVETRDVNSVFECKMEECVNYGTISGNGNASGGLVGASYGKTVINNCYNIGHISSGANVGGILGEFNSNGEKLTISNCYSLGTLQGNQIGGIVGSCPSTASYEFTNNYFCANKGAAYGNGSDSKDSTGCISKTYNEFKKQSFYENWTFGTNGVSETGWVFVSANVPFEDGNKVVKLARLAWENLEEKAVSSYTLTLDYSKCSDGTNEFKLTQDFGTFVANTYEIDPEGTEITVTATAKDGYKFYGWHTIENGKPVLKYQNTSADISYSFSDTFTEDITLYAMFYIRVKLELHDKSTANIDFGSDGDYYGPYYSNVNFNFTLSEDIVISGIYSSKTSDNAEFNLLEKDSTVSLKVENSTSNTITVTYITRPRTLYVLVDGMDYCACIDCEYTQQRLLSRS